MKARRVRGLDPSGTLRENASRVVRTRLEELYSFVPEALEGDAKALHNMRIAAKRLRYVLELTGFCFGPYAAKAARRARELQDLIGAIHDCDVLEPRIEKYLGELAEADAQALALAVGHEGGNPARIPRVRRTAYGTLAALAIDQRARRAVLFAALTRRWRALERGDFRGRLLSALEQQPAKKSA
jgi:CHAD domain-containing protein